MPRLLLIVLLASLTVESAFAQTKKIDSLQAVLDKHPQADTFRVNRLNELADALRFNEKGYDSPKAIRRDSILQQALRLAKQLKYIHGQALTLLNIAIGYYNNNPQKCQMLLEQALLLAQRSQSKMIQLSTLEWLGWVAERDDELYFQRGLALAKAWGIQVKIVDFLERMSDHYAVAGNYAQALQWRFQALKAAQKAHNADSESSALMAISSTYSSLAEYDQALSYAIKSSQVARQSGNKEQEQTALYSIGRCYRSMGRYQQAINAYQNLLKDSTLFLYLRLFVVEFLADAYERTDNLPLAFRYAFQSIALVNQFHRSDRPLFMTFLTLGRAYGKTHQVDKALHYGQQALQHAQRYPSKESLRDANQLLAQLYAQRHDYAKAYAYQSHYISLKDSLNNEEVTRKTTSMRFNDQMSRQQSQITLLTKDKQLQAEAARRQRQLLYTSLVVLALIGGLLALLYRNNRQKQRANIVLEKQKAEIQYQRDQTQQALTDLKATQVQLVQKEKMASLGELTAGIAHEIQNPLNFVNNFSEVSAEMVEELADEHQKPQPDADLETELLSDLKDNLHKITHHGQRAANIVKGMLEHARTSKGEMQPTNLNALADEYLRLAYHGQRAKDKDFNCELITHFDPTFGEVAVMAQEIGRVMLNLFNNAFYAVRERQKQSNSDYQPSVTVSTLKTKSGVEIRVRDNGMGMPQGVQQKIFQPFFTTKPTGEGTGLGLSLSYDIITKGHGGSLRVESEPGEGTEFVIELPTARVGQLA